MFVVESVCKRADGCDEEQVMWTQRHSLYRRWGDYSAVVLSANRSIGVRHPYVMAVGSRQVDWWPANLEGAAVRWVQARCGRAASLVDHMRVLV